MTKPLSPGPDDGRPDTQAILSLLNARALGFDAWHDGHGYPLDALKTMNATERAAAQMQLRQRIDAHHPMALRPSTIDPPDLKGTPPA